MVSTNERQERYRLVGLFLCACLVLQPLLLFGHLMLDDHCWRLEISETAEVVEVDLAHFGFAPHQHELGCHLDGSDGHEGQDPSHPGRCPLSVEEHFESLVGDPASVPGASTKRPVFLQLALAAASPEAIQRPREWRPGWAGAEVASGRRVDQSPLRPRAPPVA